MKMMQQVRGEGGMEGGGRVASRGWALRVVQQVRGVMGHTGG